MKCILLDTEAQTYFTTLLETSEVCLNEQVVDRDSLSLAFQQIQNIQRTGRSQEFIYHYRQQ